MSISEGRISRGQTGSFWSRQSVSCRKAVGKSTVDSVICCHPPSFPISLRCSYRTWCWRKVVKRVINMCWRMSPVGEAVVGSRAESGSPNPAEPKGAQWRRSKMTASCRTDPQNSEAVWSIAGGTSKELSPAEQCHTGAQMTWLLGTSPSFFFLCFRGGKHQPQESVPNILSLCRTKSRCWTPFCV